jgi:hypothetical protein
MAVNVDADVPAAARRGLGAPATGYGTWTGKEQGIVLRGF